MMTQVIERSPADPGSLDRKLVHLVAGWLRGRIGVNRSHHATCSVRPDVRFA